MSKVLIIDDEQSLLTTLEILFSTEGYEVRTASDGREGVQCMEDDGLPDLVITDIKMPDMDGMQVLH
ncbi:MAG: response regulator, partial [Candidatus Glassbacteria bacterium]|nr:response regulator [Candidatus Glassbacteria bacterium]